MVTRVIINRKAYALYNVLEKLEVGMVLTGSEVKSIRLGRVNFKGSYGVFVRERPYVLNLHISRYPKSSESEYNPERRRALLMKKSEINRLLGLSKMKGVTLIPLKIYFRNNLVKMAVGVCQGKKKRDRRAELKKKAIERDIEVALRGKK